VLSNPGPHPRQGSRTSFSAYEVCARFTKYDGILAIMSKLFKNRIIRTVLLIITTAIVTIAVEVGGFALYAKSISDHCHYLIQEKKKVYSPNNPDYYVLMSTGLPNECLTRDYLNQ
jgi:hypothetical protein